MEQLRGLVQHHVAGLHDYIVLVLLVVQDQQRPVLLHLLIHVDDRGHHVRVDSVHMHAQYRAIIVLAVSNMQKRISPMRN